MRPIAAMLALLAGALSAATTDGAAALERLSNEVRIAGRPLSLPGRGNEAVLALIEEAERNLGAGRPEQAAVALERALRIEPRNPTVWHYLGLARLDAGEFAQAETMAARSSSLAPGDRALRSRNARLVATARQASGQISEPLPNGLDSLEHAASDDPRVRSDRAQQRVDRAAGQSRAWAEPVTPAWPARDAAGDYAPLRQECRIWFSDRPASRQPPPIACDEAPRQLPRGAVLLVSI